MTRWPLWTAGIVVSAFAVLGGRAISAQDKYALQVPGGLSFAEFRGYEGWQVVSVSKNDNAIAVILANPTMIDAFTAGIPENGKPFPDGSRMAKVHWTLKKSEFFPDTVVSGAQHDVDFMVKDTKRFADSGGWGYAVFEHDAATGTYRPGNEGDQPPQANDAKCGFACHTLVQNRDYVFSVYGKR